MKDNAILYIGFLVLVVGFIIIISITPKGKNTIEFDILPFLGNETNETNRDSNYELSDKLGFVSNNVIVSFNDTITDQDIISFVTSKEEIISTEQLYDKTYKLVLEKDFQNRNELTNYCNELKESKIIDICEPNNIVKIDDCNKGPC